MGGQLDRSSKKPHPYVVPGTRAPRGTAPERNGARGGDRAGGFKGHSGWRACGRAGGGRQNAVESHPLSQPTRMLHCCGTHLHYRTAPPFTPPKSKFFLLSVAQNVAQSFRYTSLWRSHLYTSQDLFNAYEQCHVCFSTDKQTYQQKHSSPFRATSWGLHGQASPAAVFLIGCKMPQFRLSLPIQPCYCCCQAVYEIRPELDPNRQCGIEPVMQMVPAILHCVEILRALWVTRNKFNTNLTEGVKGPSAPQACFEILNKVVGPTEPVLKFVLDRFSI